LIAYLPGASLTLEVLVQFTPGAFMHFLETWVHVRQLMFLPGLRSGVDSRPIPTVTPNCIAGVASGRTPEIIEMMQVRQSHWSGSGS
jgi:hypothetical protein